MICGMSKSAQFIEFDLDGSSSLRLPSVVAIACANRANAFLIAARREQRTSRVEAVLADGLRGRRAHVPEPPSRSRSGLVTPYVHEL
jgi:hypothetical protein